MKKIILITVVFVLSFGIGLADFNADDFIVHTGNGTPDNTTFRNKLDEKNSTIRDGLSGFETIDFKGEKSFLAGATAFYKVHENINATLLSKKKAYQEAYFIAKRQLIEKTNGYFLENKINYNRTKMNVNSEKRNVDAMISSVKETFEAVVSGYLRGYVTYETSEHFDEKTGVGDVYVSLVITPKTLTETNQYSGIILGKDIKSALNVIFNEINNGVNVQVGGKIILLPETNEIVVVGFGTELSRYSDDPLMVKENLRDAIEVSQYRAHAALLEILRGTDNTWITGVYSKTEEGILDAYSEELNDLAVGFIEKDSTIMKDFSSFAAEKFLDIFKKTDHYDHVIKGMIPPGVIQKTDWESSLIEEKGYSWVTTVIVYYPPLTFKAQEIADALSKK